MRLRYLSVNNLEPLKNITVNFGHEPILGRDCAIRFIVGINGSGKTRLLQALSEIFLNLGHQRFPTFPVILAYDLGIGDSARTIYLRRTEEGLSKTIFIEFDRIISDVNWDLLDPKSSFVCDKMRHVYSGGKLPGSGTIGNYLPSILLAYTSGSSSRWELIFKPDTDELNSIPEVHSLDDERPLLWNSINEIEYRKDKEVNTKSIKDIRYYEDLRIGTLDKELKAANTTLFIDNTYLKLVVCSVVLSQAVKDFSKMKSPIDEKDFLAEIKESLIEGNKMHDLRGILNEVDWLWPITIKMQIVFKPNELTDRQTNVLRNLYKVSTSVIREPRPGQNRYLVFDLRQPIFIDDGPETINTASALIEAITETRDASSFEIFKNLYDLCYNKILLDVKIAFRKRTSLNVILYDWLSDGEQSFLGRMALFNLLQGQNDALIILDEPDTHFNDYWKREIVDIIDENMSNNASDILISTHSSIALTDVFDTEIVTLRKDNNDGSISVYHTPIRSFGASPSEIMVGIFNAPEYVGQRATEYLDLVLMMAAYPDIIESIWAMKDEEISIIKSDIFQELVSHVKTLPHYYGKNQQLEAHLFAILNSLHKYAKKSNGGENINVIDVLSYLQDKIGPGYYQFEFRRRLRSLKERNNAA